MLLGIIGTRAAGERQAFELQRMEGRYRDTAALVRDRLPANAVLITVWQSGSMRFHAGREIVMWDSLDPAWLDRAIAWLRVAGLQPYFLFERREEPEFRARFRGAVGRRRASTGRRASISIARCRIYDPADRARFSPARHTRPRTSASLSSAGKSNALAAQHPVSEKDVDRVDGAFADRCTPNRNFLKLIFSEPQT